VALFFLGHGVVMGHVAVTSTYRRYFSAAHRCGHCSWPRLCHYLIGIGA